MVERQVTRHLVAKIPPPALHAGFSGKPLEEPLQGKALEFRSSFSDAEKAKARELIERSFGRPLRAGYLDAPFSMAIVAPGFSGIAIIKSIDNVPYLDKFAVDPEMQGRGVGRQIWESIKSQHESLVWRAFAENPCKCWYEKNSEGSLAIVPWIVYWYGLGREKAEALAEKAAALPMTIIR
ncbi:MAG TPA: GNAT family N-acetyltransferase [Candidatus Bilamarchaeum sp.]|nr:GNAT family N-acetyltransferase [Candidatus Bilamarchaeum sp.]